jgi:hypothetical protein
MLRRRGECDNTRPTSTIGFAVLTRAELSENIARCVGLLETVCYVLTIRVKKTFQFLPLYIRGDPLNPHKALKAKKKRHTWKAHDSLSV